ncbi:MAG: hypothetical protein AB7D02_00295 [Candidatus Paceibacterota bacterium]
MFNKKINKKRILKGISLIETLTALGILMVGILSSYFLLMRALYSYKFIEDRLIAANLAQEKIEEIRQIRDNNYANWYSDYLAGRSWQWNKNLNCNFINCNETNLFNKFQRITSLTYRQSNKELVIVVTLNWETRGHSFTYQAESHLFDWANLPSR